MTARTLLWPWRGTNRNCPTGGQSRRGVGLRVLRRPHGRPLRLSRAPLRFSARFLRVSPRDCLWVNHCSSCAHPRTMSRHSGVRSGFRGRLSGASGRVGSGPNSCPTGRGHQSREGCTPSNGGVRWGLATEAPQDRAAPAGLARSPCSASGHHRHGHRGRRPLQMHPPRCRCNELAGVTPESAVVRL